MSLVLQKDPERGGSGLGVVQVLVMGKTSGKGHKGLLARSGGRSRQAGGFEGGQMSLIRRVPKHGFTNVFRKEYSIVNLKSLGDMLVAGTITPQVLVDAGLVKRKSLPIKVLGNGDLTKAIVEIGRASCRERVLASV